MFPFRLGHIVLFLFQNDAVSVDLIKFPDSISMHVYSIPSGFGVILGIRLAFGHNEPEPMCLHQVAVIGLSTQ